MLSIGGILTSSLPFLVLALPSHPSHTPAPGFVIYPIRDPDLASEAEAGRRLGEDFFKYNLRCKS